MLKLKKILIRYKTIIGIFISLLFVYLSIHNVSLKELEIVFDKISSDTLLFLLSVIFLGRLAIVLRWYFLLHFTKNKNISSVFNFVNIGYLINNLFPARAGDFVKAYLWSKKTKVSKTDSLISVAFERLFDLIGMGLLFICALVILNLPAYALNGGIILLMFCAGLLLLLLILSWKIDVIVKYQVKYSEKIFLSWILVKLKKLSNYSSFLINLRLNFIVLFLTLFIWFTYVYSGYLIITDLHPSLYAWHTSVLALLFVSITFIIPSTPGNIGVYQYACILAFQIIDAGYSREEALVYSIISQFSVYFFSLFVGFIALYVEGFRVNKIKRLSENMLNENVKGAVKIDG